MLDIVMRSIARAGGIEVPADRRIVAPPPRGRSPIRRLVGAVERWFARRPARCASKPEGDRARPGIGPTRGVFQAASGGTARLGGVADCAISPACNDNAGLPLADEFRA